MTLHMTHTWIVACLFTKNGPLAEGLDRFAPPCVQKYVLLSRDNPFFQRSHRYDSAWNGKRMFRTLQPYTSCHLSLTPRRWAAVQRWPFLAVASLGMGQVHGPPPYLTDGPLIAHVLPLSVTVASHLSFLANCGDCTSIQNKVKERG